MRKINFGILIFFGILITQLAAAAPIEDLKSTVTQVIEILESKKSLKAKRSAISEVYYKNFDSEKLAQTTLKSEYKQLSDDEKKKFAERYSRFVLVFYLDKIDKYNRNKVEFVGDEIRDNKTAIAKTLFEYQGKMANVNYFMKEKDGRWMIYDFEIEGVKLSTTYRSQFSKVLRERGYDGLIVEIDRLLAKYKQ